MHHIIHKVTTGYERLYDVTVYSVGRCLRIHRHWSLEQGYLHRTMRTVQIQSTLHV